MKLKVKTSIFANNSKLIYVLNNNKAATFVFRGGKCRIFTENKQINAAYSFLAKHIVELRLPRVNIHIDNDASFYNFLLSDMRELKYISSMMTQSVNRDEFDKVLILLKENIRIKINSEEYSEYYKFENLISRIQKYSLLEINESLEQIDFNDFKNFYESIYTFSNMTLYIFGNEDDKIITKEILSNLNYNETQLLNIKGTTGEITAKRYFKNTYGMFLNLSETNRNIGYFVLTGLISFIQKSGIEIEFIFNEYESGICVYDKFLSIESFYQKITNVFVELSERELLNIVKKEITTIFNDLRFEEYSLIVPRLDYYGVDVFSNDQITNLEIEEQLSIIMPQIYSKKSYIY